MSINQIEIRANRYLRMLRWLANQPELASINICHLGMLTNIHQYLAANADTWGSSDTRAICVLGDFIVSLYDRPLDVVDLTGEDEDQPGDANNDSGLA
jgi:hypothetical protein